MANRFIRNATSCHGKGAIARIADKAKTRGLQRAMVCPDPDLAKPGMTPKVTDVLEEAGLAYALYDNIK